MPEPVHLLLSEPQPPQTQTLAEAMHYLKLSLAKRLRSRRRSVEKESFWQKRYYDRNVPDADEFTEKLRYLHRNPVKRGLVNHPADWQWSSFRHYAYREVGVVKIESEWTARDRDAEKKPDSPRTFLRPD
jgi:putative transposase